MKNTKPLVFSCSGCSHLATMANDIALTLDNDKIAEMSCISWLIAASEEQIKEKILDRKVILIEGCEESCSSSCLSRVKVYVDVYINLANLGFSPRSANNCSLKEDSIAMNYVYEQLKINNIDINLY